MNDFGSDAGNAAIRAGSDILSKLMTAIFNLFKHLFEVWQKSPDRKLTRQKLKELVNDNAKKAFIQKLEGRAGYVRFKDMERAGINCTAVGISMTSEEMSDFSARCKREGIKFTATIDKNDLAKDKRIYNILCPVAALERMKRVVDLLNDEKLIDGIDKRIAELEGKGELTDQDKIDIESLKEQRATIRRGYCEKLNEEQAASVFENAVYGKTLRGVSFDSAVDRYTGGELDREQDAIVCDLNDPTKYIRCHGYNDVYNGKTYIKTDYEVYNGSKLVYQTNDGRFDGRPEYYWFTEKAKMRDLGGIGDTVIKFYSMPEYERFAENFKTQNEKELSGFEYKGVEGRDYMNLRERLLKKLDENGALFENGAVLDKTTGKAFTLPEDMSSVDKARIAEAEVIGKQIANYDSLVVLEAELAVANSGVITTNENTPERAAARSELDAVNAKYKTALDIEKNLHDERVSINGIQAEQEAKQQLLPNQNNVELLPDDKKLLSELESKISDKEKWIYEYGWDIEYAEDWEYKEQVMYPKLEAANGELAKMKDEYNEIKAQAIENATAAGISDDVNGDGKKLLSKYKEKIGNMRNGNVTIQTGGVERAATAAAQPHSINTQER